MTVSYAACAAAVAAAAFKAKSRLELSLAKHPSLTGHSKMSRRIAGLIPFYDYDAARFFQSDDAPGDIAERRRAGFTSLSELWGQKFGQSIAVTRESTAGISDLQFTGAYRVPFQYSRMVRDHLPSGSFLASSSGVTVTDLDGNVF